MKGFSLFEILIALTIVGILISAPNWLSLLNNIQDERKFYEANVELELLLGLLQATDNPGEAITKINLTPFCNEEVVHIGAGGYFQARTLICENVEYEINSSGSFYAKR